MGDEVDAPLDELTEIVQREGATLLTLREQVAREVAGQQHLVDRILSVLSLRDTFFSKGPWSRKDTDGEGNLKALKLDFQRIRLR